MLLVDQQEKQQATLPLNLQIGNIKTNTQRTYNSSMVRSPYYQNGSRKIKFDSPSVIYREIRIKDVKDKRKAISHSN